MAYDYWNGYTKAQIELMIADQPFVSYKRRKQEKVTKRSMDDLYDRWKAKKDSERQGDNVMAGFVKKSTTLSEFFKDK